MHRLSKLVLSLGALASLASPVLAQQPRPERPGGGFRGGPTLGVLLSNKSVQEELKLSEEQVAKVEKATREVRERHEGELGKLRDLSGPERREKGEELRRAVDHETMEALKDTLQPEQAKRLRQVWVQARGAEALATPRIQEALDLTDDQKGKVRDILEDSREKTREIFTSSEGNREEAVQKLSTHRKETLEKACAVLTDDQKAKWKEITGEPFELRLEGRGPGGPGRGPRPGGEQ